MKILILTTFLFLFADAALAQYPLHGKVIDENGKPVVGATIVVAKPHLQLNTDISGIFVLDVPDVDLHLKITHVGYSPVDTLIPSAKSRNSVIVKLSINPGMLREVTISTGYQNIAPERLTGSVVTINNNLLNRRVSSDIISRLENVTSGLLFNTGTTAVNNNTLSIRGQSTLFANTQPLIILDNFPYDGDINSINPNDIESITVLKDAAAASIWGARAGNGVIVLTSKKGKPGKPKVNFNTNLTIGNKPDQFYAPVMSTADYIDVEKKLFSQGFYNSIETSTDNRPLTPVVELLIAARDGKISTTSASAQIEAYKSIDVRKDIDRYLYQKSVIQQYALNVSGGSETNQYYLSTGYDRNKSNQVSNSNDRISLKFNNSTLLLNKRLKLDAGLIYTINNTVTDNPGSNTLLQTSNIYPLYPYLQFVSDSGEPLTITHDYRNSFIQAAAQKGLLTWTYNPLQEIGMTDNQVKSTDYRFNTAVTYTVLSGLKASLRYQYGGNMTSNRNFHNRLSYYSRNLVNQFTEVNATTGALTYDIPQGDILDIGTGTGTVSNFRGQMSFDQDLGSLWNVNAIAGYEKRRTHTLRDTYRLYGYDDSHATSAKVNYLSTFPLNYFPASRIAIPNLDSESDLQDTFISWYANAGATFKQRYTLTGSIRLDQSNVFGVNTNQKGVPLYSVGAAWEIDKESFYQSRSFPYLKLRASFGYNGNIDRDLSAFTTASFFGSNLSALNAPYANVVNPPNPELRWERIQVYNIGLDFSTWKRKINGSLDIYRKNGIDLIGSTNFPPSSGITNFFGNSANTSGKGFDLNLGINWLDKTVGWTTNILASYASDQVTSYQFKTASSTYTQTVGTPLEGKPLYGIYGYAWAGLDPANGNPRGYLNGAISSDYAGIISGTTTDDLKYIGSARPIFFGAFRNSISYRGFSASANISYRLGYYYKRSALSYSTILSGYGYQNGGDYADRWQQPGDETHTNVPSVPATINNNRDQFYAGSEIMAEKADNIRLLDVTLGYSFNNTRIRQLLGGGIEVYAYLNNLGILWKASKLSLDPDYPTGYPPVRTFALGLKIDLNK